MKPSITVLLVLLPLGCASSTTRPPISTEVLAPSPEPARQKLTVAENAIMELFVGDVALCSADDPSTLRVYGSRGALAIVGTKTGRTVLHVARPGKGVTDVEIDVTPGNPNAHVLGVGEEQVLSARGVKETSEGPRYADLVPTPGGDSFRLIGRKAGIFSVLFIFLDGTEVKHEVTVVEGDRQL